MVDKGALTDARTVTDLQLEKFMAIADKDC